MILHAVKEKLSGWSKKDFQYRQFDAVMIVQAVSWYLRYALSYELFLYRAIDKYGNPVDFLLTAKRDTEAAQRFFRKAFKNDRLFAPKTIGTDGAATFPKTLASMIEERVLPKASTHYVTKALQQGIESDHFRLKQPIPKNGCFQSFKTARQSIKGYEAMLWLKKGFEWKRS